jgi:hypothetical protein
VVEEFDAIQLSLKDICAETESAVKILRHDGHTFKQIREDRTRRFMECFNSLATEVDRIYKVIFLAWNLSYPSTGLDRPLGLQEVEAPRISTQLAHEGGEVVSLTHWPSSMEFEIQYVQTGSEMLS